MLSLTLSLCAVSKLPALSAESGEAPAAESGKSKAHGGEVSKLTDSDVVNALEKAQILAPSIRLNARVEPEEVMVATYKNPKAEDKDCKIEAVLIAKTVMDLAPEQVARVTVYFYSSSTLSKYKEVGVTAGDVKAFAAGTLSKDELLASIKIREDAINDPKKRVQEYMQESASYLKRKITTSFKGEDLMVTTSLDNNLNERNLKIEAAKVAGQAFEAAPAEIKKVIVNFEDLGEKKQKQVMTFTKDEIKTLDEALSAAVKDVPIEVVKIEGKFATPAPGTKLDLDTFEIKAGPLKDERQKLLDRLKELSKAGVGVGTTTTDALLELETKAGSESEAALQEKIAKLSELIAKFEENLKGAKEHKATGAAPKPAETVTGANSLAPAVPVGNIDVLKKMVLADPDGYVNSMAAKIIIVSPITHQVVGKYKTADEHPNFRRNLQFAIDTLKGAGRGAEAEKYQKRLDDIKAKYGD